MLSVCTQTAVTQLKWKEIPKYYYRYYGCMCVLLFFVSFFLSNLFEAFFSSFFTFQVFHKKLIIKSILKWNAFVVCFLNTNQPIVVLKVFIEFPIKISCCLSLLTIQCSLLTINISNWRLQLVCYSPACDALQIFMINVWLNLLSLRIWVMLKLSNKFDVTLCSSVKENFVLVFYLFFFSREREAKSITRPVGEALFFLKNFICSFFFGTSCRCSYQVFL